MEILEAHDYFRGATFSVVRNGVDEELMHEALEAVVFTIAQELGAMICVANCYRIASSEVNEVAKGFSGAVRYTLRLNGWRTH